MGHKGVNDKVDDATLIGTDRKIDTRIDIASSTVRYIGTAKTGTPTSVRGWKIKRETLSGSECICDWANNNPEPEHIWDERTLLF